MATTRGLVRMAVPAAVVLLGGCTTLGPDFSAPQVPWLQGWPGGAWRTLAEEAPRRAQPRDDEWWRQFDDPVLDQLVAEAQRLNPGVRTAGLRIMEARAQLGIAGSGLYPQLQQVNARGAARRQPRQRRPQYCVLVRRPGFRPGLGAGLLGQVQAGHRVGRCRLLRQHRAIRRRAGAGRGAGGEPVRVDPHHRAAAAHRQRERRDPAAQPGDHRKAVSQRQRFRARRAAGAFAVPRHAGDDPRNREQPAPDAKRAVRAARPPTRCTARAARRAARRFPKRGSR